jgi:hypothetical protein
VLDEANHTSIRCNCGEFHPGRPPERKTGCGIGASGFTLPPALASGPTKTPGEPHPVPIDEVQRKWEVKAQELEFTALDGVRSGAEKWATTISALTGIFGLTALVSGIGDVDSLAPGCKATVGVLLLLAGLCAAGAVTFAAMAAQGQPRQLWSTGELLRDHYKEAAKTAARHLTRSRQLMIPAFLLLFGAVAVTWYGPRKPAVAEHAVAIQQTGVALCGELTSDEQGRLAIRIKGQGVRTLDRVVSISGIEKCP